MDMPMADAGAGASKQLDDKIDDLFSLGDASIDVDMGLEDDITARPNFEELFMDAAGDADMGDLDENYFTLT